MDSPERSDTHYVRCLKCLKIIKCSRYDTATLLEHIRTDHPEIEIVENGNQSTKPQNEVNMPQKRKEKNDPDKTSQSEDGNIKACDPKMTDPSNDANVVYTRRYQVHSPSSSSPPPQERRKRNLYRTSIEKWRPASGTIYCPKCGVNKAPLIKTQAERSSDNSCGAACILGCWPFCFLPFLFPADSKEYLHCANCKNFLGLYDRQHNCVKPNREYVNCSETANKETVRGG